jgi:hypothetical protein
MKTLKQILEASAKPAPTTKGDIGVINPGSETSLDPKAVGEKRFKDKHTVATTGDVSGNDDKLFKASNVKAASRAPTRHGYNPGQDRAVYEAKALSAIVEKHLTPNELKKREEIAGAMERRNPGMDKSKKMAIATSVAKRVAEGMEFIEGFDESLRDQATEVFNAIGEDSQRVFKQLCNEGQYDVLAAVISGMVQEG